MKFRRGISSLVFILFIFFSLTSCQKINNNETYDQINLQLKWIDQAQFAGYYVAKEKGYYQEENININIIPGGVGIDGIQQLVNQKVDFSIVAPEEIVTAYAAGNNLKVISVIFQNNPFLLITLKQSNIKNIQDFNGKSIALLNISGKEQFLAMAQNTNIDIDSMQQVEFKMDYSDFFSGEIDIYPAFSVGSYLDIVREGIEVNQFWPDDYGVHWYSDCIVVNQSLVDQDPELIERFLRATIKGMDFVVTNPDESLEIVMKYAHLQDEKIQGDMLFSSIPLIYNGEVPIGWMSDEKWYGIIKDLYDIGRIDREFDPTELVTYDFLNNVYGNSK